jgi:hypothetical protein
VNRGEIATQQHLSISKYFFYIIPISFALVLQNQGMKKLFSFIYFVSLFITIKKIILISRKKKSCRTPSDRLASVTVHQKNEHGTHRHNSTVPSQGFVSPQPARPHVIVPIHTYVARLYAVSYHRAPGKGV